MKFIVTEPHIHKFTKDKTLKVTLVAGKKTALDTIKQKQCECGATQAYDLKRSYKGE